MSTESRARIILYPEKMSRYGDYGRPLPPAETPADGLCRVLIDCECSDPPITSRYELVQATKASAQSNYPAYVGVGAARLCGASGLLWCVGEIHSTEAEVIRDEFGMNPAIMRLDSNYSLFSLVMDARLAIKYTAWPAFHGEFGARIFALQEKKGVLYERLVRLDTAIRHKEAEAVLMWRELLAACLSRSELAALCREAIACVLPDGPYCNEASFHSSQLSVDEITAQLVAVAEAYDLRYEIINT